MCQGCEWPIGEKKKLRIGVPVNSGFSEFVDMNRDPVTNRSTGGIRGFCIDVFNTVMAELPYNVTYEYVPFEDSRGQSNGSYDQLVYQVYLQNFDAVVGDVTILANRSLYVDFTLPYTESGVTMVVPVKDHNSKSAWTFLKPMATDLWVATGVFFLLTGFVVWVFKHRINEEFRGQPAQQLGTILYFSFSTLVFAHREKLSSNLSRVVVVIWTFVVLILTSSYTASLTSMLTVQQLQPTLTDMHELVGRGYNAGYLNNSFMPSLLKRLSFDDSKLIAYNSPQEYDEAMSKGSPNGGVAAVIDEIPNIKVFLSKYCGKYMTVGPTYRTNGFGFVFPKGSPLVADVSRAILSLTEGGNFVKFEETLYTKQRCLDQSTVLASSSLTLGSFWGVFLLTGLASTSALTLFLIFFFYQHRHVLKNLGSRSSLWQKIVMLFRLYDQRDPSSLDFEEENNDREIKDGLAEHVVAPYKSNCNQSPPSLPVHTYGTSDCEDEAGTPLEGEGIPDVVIPVLNRSSLSFAEILTERIG